MFIKQIDFLEFVGTNHQCSFSLPKAYEKPATFRPAIPVADLDVVEMNFQGDDIDCWMEIQEGLHFKLEIDKIDFKLKFLIYKIFRSPNKQFI